MIAFTNSMSAGKKNKKKSSNKKSATSIRGWAILAAVLVFAVAFGVIFYFSFKDREEKAQVPLAKKSEIMASQKSSRPDPVLKGYGFDVGSMWIYETLDATLTIKVTRKYQQKDSTIYVYDFYYGNEKIAEEHRVYHKNYIAKIKSIQGESTVTVFDPPLVLYKFPLKKGEKWVNRFKVDGVEIVSEVEVADYEKIKTKGGVFMAYKIRHKTYPLGNEKNASIDADWFNPRIGLIAYSKEGGENPKALFKYSVKLIDLK